MKDPQTDVYHRHYLHQKLPELLVRASQNAPLTLLLLAPAPFAIWQQALTPLAADALIQHLAHCLQQAAPPEALLARWDHDSFAMLLPNYSKNQAEAVVDACRSSLFSTPLPAVFAMQELPLSLLAASSSFPPLAQG